MKNIILRRFFPTFLCMALALILTSCDGKDQQPVESGTGSTVRTPSVSKEEGSSSERAVPLSKDKKDKSASNSESQKEDEPAPVVYSEAAQGSLALLRDSMSCSEQIAGAVAYLGYRAQGDSTPLGEWILGNCSALADDMPFLLEIPDNCILGAGYGDLYCIVPRDENTSLAVNRVKWESLENGVWPVAEEILYREEYAQPVLVFVNYEQWSDEYPSAADVYMDMENGSSYVLCDGDRVIGYSAIVFSDDVNYQKIDGRWLNDESYGVIHRTSILSSCKGKGLAGMFFDYAEKLAKEKGIHNMRIDTHKDNVPMQHCIAKHGYTYCGVVYMVNGDGSPRDAFQKIL